MAQCEAIVGTLARFHAAWWDDARLGVSIGTWVDAAAYAERMQGFAMHFAAFTDRIGDRLSGERCDLYRRVFDAAPRLFAALPIPSQRHADPRRAHVWNVLMPKDEQSGDVRLFDWDDLANRHPSTDLSYMMAMHWYPELRRSGNGGCSITTMSRWWRRACRATIARRSTTITACRRCCRS